MNRNFLITLFAFSLPQFAMALDRPPQEFCDVPEAGLVYCDVPIEQPIRAKSCPNSSVIIADPKYCFIENAIQNAGIECTDYGYGYTRCEASPYSDSAVFQYSWVITTSNPTTTVYNGYQGDRPDLFCDVLTNYTVQMTVSGAGRSKTVSGYAVCKPGIPE